MYTLHPKLVSKYYSATTLKNSTFLLSILTCRHFVKQLVGTIYVSRFYCWERWLKRSVARGTRISRSCTALALLACRPVAVGGCRVVGDGLTAKGRPATWCCGVRGRVFFSQPVTPNRSTPVPVNRIGLTGYR